MGPVSSLQSTRRTSPQPRRMRRHEPGDRLLVAYASTPWRARPAAHRREARQSAARALSARALPRAKRLIGGRPRTGWRGPQGGRGAGPAAGIGRPETVGAANSVRGQPSCQGRLGRWAWPPCSGTPPRGGLVTTSGSYALRSLRSMAAPSGAGVRRRLGGPKRRAEGAPQSGQATGSPAWAAGRQTSNPPHTGQVYSYVGIPVSGPWPGCPDSPTPARRPSAGCRTRRRRSGARGCSRRWGCRRSR